MNRCIVFPADYVIFLKEWMILRESRIKMAMEDGTLRSQFVAQVGNGTETVAGTCIEQTQLDISSGKRLCNYVGRYRVQL